MKYLIYLAVYAIMAMIKMTEATNATNRNPEYDPKRVLGWYATRTKVIHLNPKYQPATPLDVHSAYHTVESNGIVHHLKVRYDMKCSGSVAHLCSNCNLKLTYTEAKRVAVNHFKCSY